MSKFGGGTDGGKQKSVLNNPYAPKQKPSFQGASQANNASTVTSKPSLFKKDEAKPFTKLQVKEGRNRIPNSILQSASTSNVTTPTEAARANPLHTPPSTSLLDPQSMKTTTSGKNPSKILLANRETQKKLGTATKTVKTMKKVSLKTKLKREIEELQRKKREIEELKRSKQAQYQRLEEERKRDEEAEISDTSSRELENIQIKRPKELTISEDMAERNGSTFQPTSLQKKYQNNDNLEEVRQEANEATLDEMKKGEKATALSLKPISGHGNKLPILQSVNEGLTVTRQTHDKLTDPQKECFISSQTMNSLSATKDKLQSSFVGETSSPYIPASIGPATSLHPHQYDGENLANGFSSNVDQKLAEERRRKDQREVLCRQAAALLESSESASPFSPKNSASRNPDLRQFQTPEKVYSSRDSISVPPSIALSEEEQRLLREQQRRKEQREVLRRQAAELLKRKEAEKKASNLCTPNKREQAIFAEDLAAPSPRPLSLLDEEARKSIENQRRKEQREVLRRQAAELFKKRQMGVELTPERLQTVVPSPEFEKSFSDKKRRKEQREILSRQAAELLTKKDEESKLGITIAQSPDPKSPAIASPDEDKVQAEEKRRKEQREVLRRQAAELMKKRGEDKLGIFTAPSPKPKSPTKIAPAGEQRFFTDEQKLQVHPDVLRSQHSTCHVKRNAEMNISVGNMLKAEESANESAMHVGMLEKHFSGEISFQGNQHRVQYQNYGIELHSSIGEEVHELTVTTTDASACSSAQKATQLFRSYSPSRMTLSSHEVEAIGSACFSETKSQKSLANGTFAEFSTEDNSSSGIRISSAYLVYSDPQEQRMLSTSYLPPDGQKMNYESNLSKVSNSDDLNDESLHAVSSNSFTGRTEDPMMIPDACLPANSCGKVQHSEDLLKPSQNLPGSLTIAEPIQIKIESTNDVFNDVVTTEIKPPTDIAVHSAYEKLASMAESDKIEIDEKPIYESKADSNAYSHTDAARNVPEMHEKMTEDTPPSLIASTSEYKSSVLDSNSAVPAPSNTSESSLFYTPNQYHSIPPTVALPTTYPGGVVYAGYPPPYCHLPYNPGYSGYIPIPYPTYYPYPLTPYPPYIPATSYAYGTQSNASQNLSPPQPSNQFDDKKHMQQNPNDEKVPMPSKAVLPATNSTNTKLKREKLNPKNSLSTNPMDYPSPFSSTHVIVKEPVILIKTPDESFGVTISLAIESTLVPFVPKAQKLLDLEAEKRDLPDLDPKVDLETAKRDLPDFDPHCKPEKSMLMDENHAKSKELSVDKSTPSGLTGEELLEAKPKRRQRRQRIFFSVLTVIDASAQNSRSLSSYNPSLPGQSKNVVVGKEEETNQESSKLQKGDILLSINGHSTAGLSFTDACGLFKGCTVGTDGLVRCPVIIARLKPAPKVLIPEVPKKLDIDIAALISGRLPLQQEDFIVLATSILKAVTDVSKRFLGLVLSENELHQQIAATDLSLSRIPMPLLNEEWRKVELHERHLMLVRAAQHWKNVSYVHPFSDDRNNSAFLLLTEAELCSLRAAPRPTNGFCKCGSREHQYVNDPECPLYKNLRALDVSTIEKESSESKNKKWLKSKLSSDSKLVEKALTDRLLRRKEELEAEEAEAKFVDKMETIQVKICNQAVFSPTLESIVLSAVVELSLTPKDANFFPNSLDFRMPDDTSKSAWITGSDENESDDDDDDVPLALLGSKRPNDAVDTSGKKRKGAINLRFHFLAKLVRLISEKWGHSYREPSHAQYAWRWEVFHGHNSISGSKWAAGSKNPREVGSLSLENARFLLDDETLSGFEPQRDEIAFCKAMKALSFLLLPEQTGICDELVALLTSGVLQIDEKRGIPVLACDWYSRVDILLLNDMHEKWNSSVDPVGKYGIIDEIRRLYDCWERNDEGWLLKTEKEVVFYFEDLEEWHNAFEQKHQVQLDGFDGIGKFY